MSDFIVASRAEQAKSRPAGPAALSALPIAPGTSRCKRERGPAGRIAPALLPALIWAKKRSVKPELPGEPIPVSSAADAGVKRSRVPLGALKPLAPYALAHRGRIALVPIAVRRMIDFGFSDANAGLIRAYFLAMIGVVAVLALASGARYYLVMTL